MLPPTPLSLLCAILLCFPLAIVFTFNTTSTTVFHGGATTSPLIQTPIPVSNLTHEAPIEEPISPIVVEKNNKTLNTTSQLPPPASHPAENESSDDDDSLFQLASRVNPNPKPTKKLALMFMTTAPLPFAPLWELFLKQIPNNLYNIYVHADPTFNYTTPFQGVFSRRVIPSKPTRRHSATLISAARRLLAHALLHDRSNSMFALLSPACVPLHSFNYTYRTLIKSRRSFVEILKHEPGSYDRYAARGDHVMEPELQFDDFRIGSQFWVVRRKHARAIVRDRRLWSKFKLPCLRHDTCYPEEHYFPTLLNMVDPRGCVPCTLTHVDWKGSDGSGHPRTYHKGEVGPELIWTLRGHKPRYGDDDRSNGSNSTVSKRRGTHQYPFLFARKFYPDVVQKLINMSDDVIFKD